MSNNSNILKSIFLLFFSISNTGTVFFIYPILCEYLIRINILPKWYNIGLVFSIYELGKFFGNFLWISLNKKYASSLILIISLSLLSIFNFSFTFSHSYFGLIIYRFCLGFSNNLSIIQKNIYHELSLKKKFGFILYTIRTISIIISIFIPTLSNKITLENKRNWLNIPSIILSLVNIITITIVIIMNKLKLLTIKVNKKLIQMNTFVNEDESIKIEKKISNNENTKKKEDDLININSNDETNPNSAERKINIKNSQFNKNIHNKDGDSINFKDNKREQSDLISKNDKLTKQNFNNSSNLNLENTKMINSPNINKKDYSKNKELKFGLIFTYLNILDSILFIWIIIFLYIELNWNPIKFGIYFSIYHFSFSILNYPLTKKLVNKSIQEDKKKIFYQMRICLIILIILTSISGVSIYIYYLKFLGKKIEKMILIILFFLTLSRNLINSLCIQMFQIYIAIEFNVYSENMRKVEQIKQYLISFSKSIFSIISSFAYYLLVLEKEFKIIDLNLSIYILCYFIIYPTILILIIIILKNCI